MSTERIEELKLKRQKLQEELQLKKVLTRVKSQLEHLEKLGEEYSVYSAFEHLNWIDSHVQVRNRDGYNGSHGDFQIDVDDADAINCLLIKEEEIKSEKFNTQFLSLISADLKLVICYQGGDPELEISTKAFLDNPNVFFSSPETWVLTSDKKWIIEHIWDQGVIRFIELSDKKPTLFLRLSIEV